MPIIRELLKSFKPETTLGELLELDEEGDIDLKVMFSNLLEAERCE